MSSVDVQKMSTAERLRMMETLWDALCHEPKLPESPEWHREILVDRRRRIESGKAKFVSIEEARKRLQG
jgi:putative addiction module component (TIGR02574 family)